MSILSSCMSLVSDGSSGIRAIALGRRGIRLALSNAWFQSAGLVIERCRLGPHFDAGEGFRWNQVPPKTGILLGFGGTSF